MSRTAALKHTWLLQSERALGSVVDGGVQQAVRTLDSYASCTTNAPFCACPLLFFCRSGSTQQTQVTLGDCVIIPERKKQGSSTVVEEMVGRVTDIFVTVRVRAAAERRLIFTRFKHC